MNPILIEEQDLCIARIEGLFQAAFLKTRTDDDGDLVIYSDGATTLISLDERNHLVRMSALYGIKQEASEAQINALVNRLNDSVVMVRFASPKTDVLMADYYLMYEERIPAYQIVASMRLFARIIPAALQRSDPDDIIE